MAAPELRGEGALPQAPPPPRGCAGCPVRGFWAQARPLRAPSPPPRSKDVAGCPAICHAEPCGWRGSGREPAGTRPTWVGGDITTDPAPGQPGMCEDRGAAVGVGPRPGVVTRRVGGRQGGPGGRQGQGGGGDPDGQTLLSQAAHVGQGPSWVPLGSCQARQVRGPGSPAAPLRPAGQGGEGPGVQPGGGLSPSCAALELPCLWAAWPMFSHLEAVISLPQCFHSRVHSHVSEPQVTVPGTGVCAAGVCCPRTSGDSSAWTCRGQRGPGTWGDEGPTRVADVRGRAHCCR